MQQQLWRACGEAGANSSRTQKIRKAIAADKSLSAEGHRVKITTQGGKVPLPKH
jgi:hypothetical protein